MIQVRGRRSEVYVLVGGTGASILDDSDEHILAQCELEDLKNEVNSKFPPDLELQIQSSDGFGTYLFHEASLVGTPRSLFLHFTCHHPNKYWEGRYGLATLLDAIIGQVAHHDEFKVEDKELEDDWKRLVLSVKVAPKVNLLEFIAAASHQLAKIIKEAEIALGGLVWKKDYEKNEKLFCTEVLTPLLRRMGFLAVRYRHGVREYGKDFTFSEMTPFGTLRHHGLQAKAGDISGKVNAAVDEIIGQVGDAFAMPYYEIGSKEPRYISTFIVAISGIFTANAKEKIAEKIPKGVLGSVLFLDRESIIELVERYWLAKA